MFKNARENQNRTGFHTVLKPAFIQSFRPSNMKNVFKKTGIFPFNGDAIPREAVAPARLADRNTPHNNKIIKIL
jgi:hypothetical protein